METLSDLFNFLACGQLRIPEHAFVHRTAWKIAFRIADATHVEAFNNFWFQPVANDEFGRTAADIDDEALVIRRGQTVGNANVDQPCLFTTGDDFDRIAENGFGFLHKRIGVFRHSQGIGADHAHRILWQPAQAFGEQAKCREGAFCGCRIDRFFGCDTGTEAHRFLQRIERIELTIDDAADLQMKAV